MARLKDRFISFVYWMQFISGILFVVAAVKRFDEFIGLFFIQLWFAGVYMFFELRS